MTHSEQTKKLISKPYFILLIILVLLFCLDAFVLKPFIKEHYLDQDLQSFKDFSWRYLLVIAVVIAIVVSICIKATKIIQIISVCLYSAFFALWAFRTLLIQILLFTNFQTEREHIINTYEVINHKEAMVFWMDGGKGNSIHDDNAIELIDKKRKAKGLKSIFEYKTGDKVKVEFKRGIFNVNYLD